MVFEGFEEKNDSKLLVQVDISCSVEVMSILILFKILTFILFGFILPNNILLILNHIACVKTTD